MNKPATDINSKDHVSRYPSKFYRVAVKAVIRNNKGDVLVVKEDEYTTWDIPGGGWEHNETEHEALARELQEEVGFTGEFTAKLLKPAVF